MFHSIAKSISEEMCRLEAIDARDRTDGTPRLQRLRQISPETGKFLAILAAAAPAGDIIDIGTSAGYSALYIALACRTTGRKLTTFEILSEKVALARRTIERAEAGDVIELIEGDARDFLTDYNQIAFCFLDAEKEVYLDCYEIIVPKMVRGGILTADNVLSHEQELRPFVQRAVTDDRVDAVVVPIGKGVLVCRKT